MRSMPVKREPGENPGRSGHCNQGAKRRNPLYASTYEKGRSVKIWEPGNLLVLWGVEVSAQDFLPSDMECLMSPHQEPKNGIYALPILQGEMLWMSGGAVFLSHFPPQINGDRFRLAVAWYRSILSHSAFLLPFRGRFLFHGNSLVSLMEKKHCSCLQVKNGL